MKPLILAILLLTVPAYADNGEIFVDGESGVIRLEDEGTIRGWIKELDFRGSGVSNTRTGIKGTVTVDVSGAEVDTLDTVCGRGATTDVNITSTATLEVATATVTYGANFATTYGRVGIGTIAPAYLLDVLGTVGIGTSSAGDALVVYTDGNVGIGTVAPTLELDIIKSTIGIGSTAQSDTMYIAGGNVGIGTTAPAYGLDVVNSNGVGIGTSAAGGALVVSTSDNVGIGTTVPLAKLDVDGTVKAARFLSEAQDSGVTLTTVDFGKTITVDSGSDQTVSLPSVGSTDIGCWFTIVKLGAGKVTIDAADSDTIADSGAGDTIYNDQATEDYATITLQLVAETEWVATGAHGTWVTTDI